MVDTNILVYAHREELPHHEISLRCITQLAESNAPWGITVFTIGEFLRVVTHPRVFDPPSSLKQATSALQNMLLSPSIRILIPGEHFVQCLFECVNEGDTRGNLVFDAQIAAVCYEYGIREIVTFDRDFARFKKLHAISAGEYLID